MHMNKCSIKKKLKERKPKVKCGNCCRSQHLLKAPNSTMENVNRLHPLAEKTNHRQYSDAFKACLVNVMLSFLLFWDSYGVVSTHNVRDTLSEFIFTFLSLVDCLKFSLMTQCGPLSQRLQNGPQISGRTETQGRGKAGDAGRSCHFQITHCWLGVCLGTSHILLTRNSRMSYQL